jgi:hypothetical protein
MNLGQMYIPFGFECPEPDNARAALERSLMIQRVFVNQRDRGFTLLGPTAPKLTWTAGAFSGAGLNTGDYNKNKDLMGSVRYKLGSMNVGLSGYWGVGVKDSAGNIVKSPNNLKQRYSIDAQRNWPRLNVIGEFVTAKGCEGFSTTVSPDKTFSGGYGQIVYGLNKQHQLVAKYEWITLDPLFPAFGRRDTWNIGLVRFMDDKTRVKLFYTKNNEALNSINNDTVTLEWITIY